MDELGEGAALLSPFSALSLSLSRLVSANSFLAVEAVVVADGEPVPLLEVGEVTSSALPCLLPIGRERRTVDGQSLGWLTGQGGCTVVEREARGEEGCE